jgi:dTDP-4-dehydrorhamnose reductase
MTKILLIGNQGQLGNELSNLLRVNNLDFIGINQNDLDLTQSSLIAPFIHKYQPEIIINCSAYTEVDKAESDQETAYQVNAIAPKILAQTAENLGAYLIHISTDYVFDGKKNQPYLETDHTNPLGIYGQSKLAGEEAIINHCDKYLILRTAWVYGLFGKGNFVKTMLRLGGEKTELKVVMDQIGSPTWTKDLSQTIYQLIPQLNPEISGIYHYTNSGVCSWYDFAVTIFTEAKKLGFPLTIEKVIPITTQEYPTPAKRPAYSVLSTQKIANLLGDIPPHWQKSLTLMLTLMLKEYPV